MRIAEKYASVERTVMPIDDNFGEAEVVEVARPFIGNAGESKPLRVRIDTVPQETIAKNLDDAAAMAIAMQVLSDSGEHQLGFKVEYSV